MPKRNDEIRNEADIEPQRLRLARELRGLTQAELAAKVDLTSAAISQFESGSARPGHHTVSALAENLEVPSRFLGLPIEESHEGFFRSLRRTSIADRRRARAIGFIAHDIAMLAPSARRLPEPSIPSFPTATLEVDENEIEKISMRIRRAWQIPVGPIANMVELLERHGACVIRLPLKSTDVDAFSLPFEDRPIVVLGADKNDKARSRFDAAHELGHLVMHGRQFWGLPEVEKQAYTFAAAFLMPAKEIRDSLPQSVDWPTLFELKQHWQVSIAALLRRAKGLRRMSEANYLTAVKALSSRGWRRVEPIPLGMPEQPRSLQQLIRKDGASMRDYLPDSVVSSLAAAVGA